MDTPEALIRRHCPERAVIVSTDDPSAESRLRSIPGVDDVIAKDGRITVSGSGTNLVSEVIGCISESGMQVSDFRTVMPTLEDVFLKVTGHSIRD